MGESLTCGAFGSSAGAAISKAEVAAAQAAWAKGIVDIGAAFSAKGDYKGKAAEVLDSLYGYSSGMEVLFKPTKAAAVPFRPTRDGAASYFCGGSVPEDKGFAIAPWTKVRFANHGTLLNADAATAMGEYYLTDTSGVEHKAEYTFQYKKAKDGS